MMDEMMAPNPAAGQGLGASQDQMNGARLALYLLQTNPGGFAQLMKAANPEFGARIEALSRLGPEEAGGAHKALVRELFEAFPGSEGMGEFRGALEAGAGSVPAVEAPPAPGQMAAPAPASESPPAKPAFKSADRSKRSPMNPNGSVARK